MMAAMAMIQFQLVSSVLYQYYYHTDLLLYLQAIRLMVKTDRTAFMIFVVVH